MLIILLEMDRKLYTFTRLLIIFTTIKVCGSCFTNNTFNTVSIETGSSFYQECYCTIPGASVDSLKWIGPNDEEIELLGPATKTNVFTEKKAQSISLHIPSISKSISGAYRCISERDGHRYTKSYIIQAYDKLFFVSTDKKQFITKGTQSVVRCEARGESDPLMTWYRGEEIPIQLTDDDKYVITQNGLQIKDVKHEDGGTYICSASVLETGEEVERSIQVEVISIPVIEEIKVYPNTTVVVGDPLRIECGANGTPAPKYSWMKTTRDHKKARPKIVSYANNTNKIELSRTVATDQGTYSCIASNQAGVATRSLDIQVLLPAQIEELDNVTATEGSRAQIICKASGRPQPKLSMTFFGELQADTSIAYEEIRSQTNDSESMFILTFINVTRAHAGHYVCEASNEVGAVNASTVMDVLHKPFFEKTTETVWGWDGITVNLSCFYESSPPGKLKWRYFETVEKSRELDFENETEIIINFEEEPYYGTYECFVENTIGEATKRFVLKKASPPPAVQKVTIGEVTATSITFAIEAASKVDGPPIIGYTAEYDKAFNYQHISIHLNRTWSVDRPITIDNLEPGSKYLVKFAALNEVGISPWSDIITVETPPRSVPNRPSWKAVTKESNSTENDDLNIGWEYPADNGDPIDFYLLRYCPIFEGDISWRDCGELLLSPLTTQLHVHQYLDSNTTYHLLLSAHNKEGNSSAAELYLTTPVDHTSRGSRDILSAEVVIGLAVTIVILSIIALDVLLFFFLRKGIIANLYYRKSRKMRQGNLFSREKKVLLRDSIKNDKDIPKNRPTGVITGKHSAV